MDSIAKKTLQKYLHPGERLLWTARPNARALFVRALPGLLFAFAWASIPLGILFGFISSSGAATSTKPSAIFFAPFVLIPLFFLTMALYLVLMGFRTIRSCWSIYYGISDKRAMILNALPPQRLRSVFPSDLGAIELTGNSDYGTIEMPLAAPHRGFYRNDIATGFVGISNPQQVEGLLINLINNGAQSRTKR